MSDEIKEPSGLPDGASSDQTESQAQEMPASSEQNQVDYLSFKKSVDREKKAVERARLAEERAERLEQEQLEKAGKLDELVQSLRAENQKLKNETRQVVGNFAYKSVRGQLQTEAAKLGCLNPASLAKLVDVDSFDVDTDTFEADSEQLKVAIEGVRKENPWLFSKPSPGINNSNPAIDAKGKKGGSKRLGEMSDDELMKAWSNDKGR